MCRVWLRGTVINMTRLVARIKILPPDSETDMESLANVLKSNVPEGMELKAHAKEPIAFGLNALVGDFLLDDAEGEMEKLEESIRKIKGLENFKSSTLADSL